MLPGSHRAAASRRTVQRRSPSGTGPRFASMRLKLRMASASSWQGSVVTPGGAPAPPGCVVANHARGRRTSLRHQERLRTAPLVERGHGTIVILGILSRAAVVPAKAETYNHTLQYGPPLSRGRPGSIKHDSTLSSDSAHHSIRGPVRHQAPSGWGTCATVRNPVAAARSPSYGGQPEHPQTTTQAIGGSSRLPMLGRC